MKILSITAQKPNSTGSGVFLTGLVKSFAQMGHIQAVLAGIYKEDKVELGEKTEFYPVYFDTEQIPFKIVGMSDEMPYESTLYSTMSDEMVHRFKQEFKKQIETAVAEFQPDIILCHHLYLLTALTRQTVNDRPVFGFCHNTDLRQMTKNPLERAYIGEYIRRLNGIFAIHDEQKKEIMKLYEVGAERVFITGTGYNDKLFRLDPSIRKPTDIKTVIFAGKISEKKGVKSLIKSLSHLSLPRDVLKVKLAGGYGNEKEYLSIKELAKKSPYPVQFTGNLSQEGLAVEYNQSDVFVLPSFFEGIPLTVIEALACGNKVVVTDLPGIQKFISEHIKQAQIYYVKPPRMRRADEPLEEDLTTFERNLAESLERCLRAENRGVPSMEHMTWLNICKKVLSYCER